MLFEGRFWPGFADGSVTLTFRRWRRRQVVAGRRYRTARTIVEVESIDEVDPRTITDADARGSGYPDAAALVAELRGSSDLPVYRIAFHVVDEPDPRAVLAATGELGTDDVAAIDRRLARLDAASAGRPWTLAVLDTIATRPAVRAPDLAAGFGRETQPFKRDVRKLKELGLTLSLDVGYRLSPRGEAYLAATRRRLIERHALSSTSNALPTNRRSSASLGSVVASIGEDLLAGVVEVDVVLDEQFRPARRSLVHVDVAQALPPLGAAWSIAPFTAPGSGGIGQSSLTFTQ